MKAELYTQEIPTECLPHEVGFFVYTWFGFFVFHNGEKGVMDKIINIPISLIRGFKGNKDSLEMLACAIIIKSKHQNSTLYDLKITSMMNFFGLSYKKAKKVKEMMIGHELFVYNKKKDCIFAKSFKSKDTKEYGKKHKYNAKADYCRKLKVKDGITLREMVRELRNTLLLCAINASTRGHDGFKIAMNHEKTTFSTKQNAKRVIPQRVLASVIGMSGSSASRYIKEMEKNNVVKKSKVIAECVVPVLNDVTGEEYKRTSDSNFVAYHDCKHGGWSGWHIYGKRYTIEKREVSDSFKNVIYNYIRKAKGGVTTSCELDGDGYFSKFRYLN